MSALGNSGPDQSNDYLIESATLFTDRVEGGYAIDIKRLITDFQIFEHIDKPYITAQFAFVDSYSIVQGFDLQGGEKLTIRIKSSIASNNSSRVIEKEFAVSKILKTQKANDQTDTVYIHCIEYHAFVSNAYNVNRAYTGSPNTIISSICEEYLDKKVLYTEDIFQGNMKVIVPNLNPLESSIWLKNRATNPDGLPFYLFSSFGDNYLRFYDLGTMMRAGVMNKEHPYAYTQSSSTSLNNNRFHIIQSYSHANTEDLYALIERGAVGSRYTFLDTGTGIPQEVNFSIDEVFQDLLSKDYIDKQQSNYNYGPGYKIKETNLHNLKSKNITQIASSGSYYQGGSDFKAYNEEVGAQSHRQKVVGDALKMFMTKSPITIQVAGRNFIDGPNYLVDEGHYTLGMKVRVIFYDNTPDTPGKPSIDKKKSGDYIIYATKHMFSLERYDTQLLLAKLANFNGDFEI